MPNTQSRKVAALTVPPPLPGAPAPLTPPKPRRGAPIRITRKVGQAIALMVWKGLKRDEAAVAAGMAPAGLYSALRKPHVRAHYLAELEVLRTSALSRNFHTLETIAETGANDMAKVAAIRLMQRRDDVDNMRTGAGAFQSPGLTIQIVTDAPKPLTIQNNDLLSE